MHVMALMPKSTETDLRLDTREHLLAAISIDKPQESSLLARVRSEEESERMPPTASHKKPLTARQIDLLERWISQGAPWGKHWSFELPKQAGIPNGDWSNPIDALVSQRLHEEGLSLAKPAAWHTRMRRLAFDLTGLPPDEKALAKYRGQDDLQSLCRRTLGITTLR